MKAKDESRKCGNCHRTKTGECSGVGEPCEDYIPAYTITKEEQKLWPDAERRFSVNYNTQKTRLKNEIGCSTYSLSTHTYSYDDSDPRNPWK